jgi:hypothetical protein
MVFILSIYMLLIMLRIIYFSNSWIIHALLTCGGIHMQNVAHLALFLSCDFHVFLCDLARG